MRCCPPPVDAASQPAALAFLLARLTGQKERNREECCSINGPAIFVQERTHERSNATGACSAGSGHVQVLDTAAVESLYGERHESEPQGLGSAWDAPTNKNGPCVALTLHQKPPRTVNRGPSQIALLLNTSNILSTGLRFNLPLCGKLACFKTNSHVLSASGKDCVGPCSVAGFVNVMLIDDTRAFVACMITHDPWRGYFGGIRVVQTGHTNSSSHALWMQWVYAPCPHDWRFDDYHSRLPPPLEDAGRLSRRKGKPFARSRVVAST